MQTHEYVLEGHYGESAGWELLTTEDSRSEITKRRKEYTEADPGVRYRIRRTMTRAYLTAWACRAADHINGVTPARYPTLGSLGDFRSEFYPYWNGRTWASAYRHVLEQLGERDQP